MASQVEPGKSESHEPNRSQASSGSIFVLAIWFGLVAGFLEAAVLTVLQLGPGWMKWSLRPYGVSNDFFWIAPVMNASYFLVLAVGLAFIAPVFKFVPRVNLTGDQVAVLVFSWCACYVPLRTPDQLYRWSVLLLSTGVAVRALTWYRRAPAV